MAETQTPQLMTVAEYIKARGIKTPQVINGWVRNQGAPCEYIEGKRMIPVEAFDAWLRDKEDNKQEGKGTTKAASVSRKTNVKKGTLLMHNSRKGVVITEVHKIKEYLAWGQSAHGAPGTMNSMLPFAWDKLASVIRKGELVVVNPHIVVDLLIESYEHQMDQGRLDPDTYENIMALLKALKQQTDPSAGADDIEVGDEEEEEEEEQDEDNIEEEDSEAEQGEVE